jgi:hypothetical protein
MYPGMGQDERTTFAPYSAFDIPADLRQLHGRYDVEATARRVRNFRYAEEWMMMTMAGWHELGKRLPELRCGRRAVTASESANGGFADFIQAISEPESPDQTIEKLAGLCDVLLPHLIEVYERTSRETDQICDAPTIELLEDILRKRRRHETWGKEVLDRLCDTDARRERRRERAETMRKLLADCGGVTGEGAV